MTFNETLDDFVGMHAAIFPSGAAAPPIGTEDFSEDPPPTDAEDVDAAVEVFAMRLRTLLDRRDLKALRAILDEEFDEDLWRRGVWRIFGVIVELIGGFAPSGEERINPPKFESIIRALFCRAIESFPPKEALLTLLEAMEKSEFDDVAFCHLVAPLASVLVKMGNGLENRARWKSTTMALHTVRRHLATLAPPSLEKIEKMSELNLADQCLETTRIAVSVTSTIGFVAEFQPEIIKTWKGRGAKTRTNPLIDPNLEVESFVKHIFSLFDVPLAPCHFELGVDSPEAAASSSLEPSPELLNKICVGGAAQSPPSDLERQFLRLLSLVEGFFSDGVSAMTALKEEIDRAARRRKRKKVEKEADDDDENVSKDTDDEKPAKVSGLAAGCFAHALLRLGTPAIPLVYSAEQVFCCVAALTSPLLLAGTDLIVLKGMQSLESATEKLAPGSLDRKALQEPAVKKILSDVCETVIIECPSKLVRKMAVDWLQIFVSKFEPEARFFLIRRLYAVAAHSGLRGFVISYLLKPEIQSALDAVTPRSSPHEKVVHLSATHRRFLGASMIPWFRQMFFLPDGVETNLLENQETLMAALNLARFLFIRDPKTRNASGIWSGLSSIRQKFLDPLRKAIDLTRGHYELEIRNLELGTKSSTTEVALETPTTPQLSPEQETKFLKDSCVQLDLLDSIYCRVSELATES